MVKHLAGSRYFAGMFRWPLLITSCLPLFLAASDGSPWVFGTRAAVGFMAPHHKSVWIMVDRHALAGEFYAQRSYSGERAWHGNYIEPRWGLSVLFLDAGSDRMGPAVRLLSYLELPLVEPGTWEFTTRIGGGVGLVRDPFDRVDNFKQHAIGGKLNIAIQWGLNLRRGFGRHAVDLGFAIDHLSNGAMQQPNLGINVPTLALGYALQLGNPSPARLVPDTTWRQQPRTRIQAMANVGWNEVYPVNSGRRSVYSLSGTAYRQATAKSAFGVGMDLFNKGTTSLVDTALADRSRASLTQVGLHASYALLFGDLTLSYSMGAYLQTPVQERAAVYTRVGVQQQLTPKVFMNVTLKSHLFVADHIELGVGYRFR